QEEDTHPSLDTSLNHEEDDQEIDEPQININPIRRSTRTRRPTDRLCLYVDAEEHELVEMQSDKWLNAMNVEMQSMKDNEVWELVDLPPNGKTVGHKWLFKKKTDMDGAVHTYKARLVAKGFTQTPGIDYEETFSLVADIRAIRILIAIAAFYDYKIWQMDVKTAFLNGYLYKEQASRQWNKRFDDEIKKFGFSQNHDEPCVYIKASRSYVTFLILYVDDILIMGNNILMLQDVKSYLGRCFAMKDLGEAAYILRIKIYRDRSKRLIGLCQSAYIEKILKRYYMENSKRGMIPMHEKLKFSKSQGASTPAKIQRMQNIPSLRLLDRLCDAHWTAVKNILKYLRNTKDMFLTGYVFILNGSAVDWKSTKQSIFATSSTDVEYIVAFDASKEAVWIRKFIYGLGVVPTIEEPINMYCVTSENFRNFKGDIRLSEGAHLQHSRDASDRGMARPALPQHSRTHCSQTHDPFYPYLLIKPGSKFSTIVHKYVTEASRIFTLNAIMGKRDDFKCVEAKDKSNLKTSL
ncbi:retrotransposon protein, putative, ty1-copia subclass, partial [Tanacetum coccineum]